VASNAPGSPHSAPLSGTGLTPGLSLAPATVDFGNEPVATTSGARTITVTNTGTAPVKVSNIARLGTNAAAFTVTSRGCRAIAVGGRCTISVTFRPGALGARTASIQLTGDAPGSRTRCL
jgi:hypothetical protein